HIMSGNDYAYGRNLVLKKFVAAIGQVKRVTTYNSANRKMNETINHYLHDGLEDLSHNQFFTAYEQRLKQYKKQGLFKGRYAEMKQVSNREASANTDHFYVTMSAKEEYPCVPVGNTTIDYVTQVTSSTKIFEYDFYSGNVTKFVYKDPKGYFIEEEITPAYWEIPRMGS